MAKSKKKHAKRPHERSVGTEQTGTKRVNRGRKLKADTQIYCDLEFNQDTRTGIRVSSITDELYNKHVYSWDLLYGKWIGLLKKRSLFDHVESCNIYYFDRENKRVRIRVDDNTSFRAGIEDMADGDIVFHVLGDSGDNSERQKSRHLTTDPRQLQPSHSTLKVHQHHQSSNSDKEYLDDGEDVEVDAEQESDELQEANDTTRSLFSSVQEDGGNSPWLDHAVTVERSRRDISEELASPIGRESSEAHPIKWDGGSDGIQSSSTDDSGLSSSGSHRVPRQVSHEINGGSIAQLVPNKDSEHGAAERLIYPTESHSKTAPLIIVSSDGEEEEARSRSEKQPSPAGLSHEKNVQPSHQVSGNNSYVAPTCVEEKRTEAISQVIGSPVTDKSTGFNSIERGHPNQDAASPSTTAAPSGHSGGEVIMHPRLASFCSPTPKPAKLDRADQLNNTDQMDANELLLATTQATAYHGKSSQRARAHSQLLTNWPPAPSVKQAVPARRTELDDKITPKPQHGMIPPPLSTVKQPRTTSNQSGRQATGVSSDKSHEGDGDGQGQPCSLFDSLDMEEYGEPSQSGGDPEKTQFKDVWDDIQDDSDSADSDNGSESLKGVHGGTSRELVEDDEDGDEKEPSKNEMILQALKNSSFTRLNKKTFAEYTQFFKISDRLAAEDPYTTVNIKGLKRMPNPHQAFAAFCMLKQERTLVGGGLLCDDMGVGKTQIVLVHAVLTRWLAYIWEDVTKAWEEKSDRHHPKGSSNTNPCQMDGRYPIQCACIAGSITSRLEAQHGFNVVVVPPRLVWNWVNEFELCIDSKSRGGLTLAVGHRDTHGLPTFEDVLSTGQFDSQNEKELEACYSTWVKARRQGKTQAKEPHSNVTATAWQTRCFIVTTPLSFENHVEKYLTKSLSVVSRNGEHRYQWDTTSRFCANVYQDEFHEVKGVNTRIVTALQRLSAKMHRPHYWGMSGYPLVTGPVDLVSWIKILRTPEWLKDKVLLNANEKKFKELHNEFIRPAGKRESGDYEKRLQNVYTKVMKFNDQVMIRRKASDTWGFENPKPIIRLPPNDHREIFVTDKFDENTKAGMKRLMRRFNRGVHSQKGHGAAEKFDNYLRWGKHSQKARICSTLPALAHHDNVALTVQDMQNAEKGLNNLTQVSDVLDTVVPFSRKFQVVRKIIAKLPPDEEFVGENGEPVPIKVILLTKFPIVADALHKFLVQEFPTKAIDLITSKTKDRDNRIMAFETANAGEQPEKLPRSAEILVSTAKILGTGFNLVRAQVLILVEVLDSPSDEKQAIKRVWRNGQRHKETLTIALRSKDNEVEKKLLARHKLRAELAETTTNASLPGKARNNIEERDDDSYDYDI